MPFNNQAIQDVDVIFESVAVIIFIASLVVPLAFSVRKPKPTQIKIDTDTSDAEYVINENGLLERVKRHNPQHD